MSNHSQDRQPSEIELIQHYGYVYRIRNLITGSTYIGKHRHNPTQGWRMYMGSGDYLEQEMAAYGIDNFSKEWIAWTDDEIQSFLVEAIYMTRELELPGFSYNYANSYSINRDGKSNLRNFAFTASFRERARLEAFVESATALKESAESLAEQIELHEMRLGYELALKIKADRFKATGRLDDKDRD